ncbi:zinc finger protein 184-like [Penaeus monodon]|uniref:zinc finger protein 184-like n=1 Tax=Penaeus monodon TaxID=6687 RepID=UPI0018A78BAF|nr:zinc finger protein 184-like [Penaeus monodon]
MASADVIREAALYLEYFLQGMSECNVIGSYTVQFLEMKGFTERIQTSLATNLVQLITNMRNLVVKLDESLLPVCDVEVQTEMVSQCSICNCPGLLSDHLKTVPLLGKDKHVDSQEKSCEAAELSHFLSPTPLLHLKQEIPCVSDSVSAGSSQCDQDDMDVNNISLKDIDSKEIAKMQDPRIGTDSQLDKCVLATPLQTALDENMDLDYANSTQLEEGQGEILLDHLEGSDATHSDGLMYSVYTMNSCGALQLVSRVLSKNASSKDSVEEPVERAMIEINNTKEEDHRSPDHLESLTLQEQEQGNQVHIANASQEEMVVAPDIPSFEGRPLLKSSLKSLNTPKILQAKTPAHGSAGGTILTDIVKLGPEDLSTSTWCGICEKEFPSAGSLKVHLSRIHSQVKWCHTCTKTISSEEEMCDHVRECHADLQFVCGICGQSLRTNAAFQRHMDIHKGLRGSACEICGQTFSRTEYCREHKRIHTGEKPYKCETCKKSFSRSSNLYTHMRTHNTEAQRHICNVCFKSFARADKLKDHMIRHLQIKRYACRLCPKAYNEKRDLTKHLEKVHSSNDNLDT